MAEPRDIPASLTACFGPGQIRRGRDEDAIDGLVPSLALTVREPDEIANVVHEAANEDLGVVAVGSGSSPGPASPERYDIRLSLSGMAALTEFSPADMTVTAEAGMTLAGLNRRLAEQGQRLPLDPASPERRTLGGLAAEGFSGGLAYGFGAMRDLVLGLTVVDGRGRRLRTGGRVVKNVAGYDLPLLFIGSAGTLGVITELTLRTYPLAESEGTLVFGLSSAEEAAETAALLFASPLPLAALDLAADDSAGAEPWQLHLRLEGSPAELRHQRACMVELLGRDPERQLSSWSSPAVLHDKDPVALATVTLPARTVPVAARLMEAARRAPAGRGPVRLGANLGSGRVMVATAGLAAADEPAWIGHMRAAEARLRVERCSPETKASVEVWPETASNNGSRRLMAEIKRRFDPALVLSPGRQPAAL